MQSTQTIALAAILLPLLFTSTEAQDGRRLTREPTLVIEPQGRMGQCNTMAFTSDGKHLLAAGDDREVRSWPVQNGKLDIDGQRNLRWAIYRERLGQIYAMALSPDAENRLVAVAGNGVRNRSLAVIDRFTGEVKHSAQEMDPKARRRWRIWCLAFAPSGQELAYGTDDGEIWIWSFKDGQRRVGTHPTPKESPPLTAILVEYLAKDRLLSVARDGSFFEWTIGADRAPPRRLAKFSKGSVTQAAVSRNHEWVAVAQEDRSVPIELLSLKSLKRSVLTTGPSLLPQSLAFDAKGDRLAVGLRRVPDQASFFKVLDGQIDVFDLRPPVPKKTVSQHTEALVEAVAFHPQSDHLAVAAGDNYETRLWKVGSPWATAQTVRGHGGCLWSIAFDTGGRRLGYRTHRVLDPSHPNARGEGEWSVFDLSTRTWIADPREFKPVRPLDTLNGWSIVADPTDASIWRAVRKTAKHALPLDPGHDSFPMCYTFLNPSAPKGPVRLAVGHLWGVSVFELTDARVEKVRCFVGHQGEVTSVAPSPDHKLLLSASRDQTIAAWSLAPWPSHAVLGAKFRSNGDQFLVDTVDAGSPAWQSGMTPGDEVVEFKRLNQPVAGGPAAWEKELGKSISGQSLSFLVQRKAATIECTTSVRQRPLWKFFPTHDREWVLWRWHDSYYDTSTRGDSHLGWQISGEVHETPQFHAAEQFRRRFHRPDKLTESLERMVVDATKISVPELLPPRVQLKITRGEKELEVRVSAIPQVSSDSQGEAFMQLEELSLWINDYRVANWKGAQKVQVVSIPLDHLRRGQNEVVAQAFNQAGVRGDSVIEQVTVNRKPAAAALHGLAVGAAKYQAATNGEYDDLYFPANDARAVAEAWKSSRSDRLFQRSTFDVLADEEVTLSAILNRLDVLSKTASPDDLLILFLCGHGFARPIGSTEVAVGSFTFLIPASFDAARPAESGLTGQLLFEKLSQLRCRKLVLLDLCHSGGSADLIRELAPTGIGPVVFASCEAREVSFEIPDLGYGVFTSALLRSLNEEFPKADRDRDGFLTCSELFASTHSRVAVLMKENSERTSGKSQNPCCLMRKDDEILRVMERLSAGGTP